MISLILRCYSSIVLHYLSILQGYLSIRHAYYSITLPYRRQIFPYWECFIPCPGTKFSLPGNKTLSFALLLGNLSHTDLNHLTDSYCDSFSSFTSLVGLERASILPTTRFTIFTASAMSMSPSPFTSAAASMNVGVAFPTT